MASLQHRWLTSSKTLTFLVQALLLIENNELAVLVSLLEDILALLDVAVVVLQTKEGGHQGHVGLKRGEDKCRLHNMNTKHFKTFIYPTL